MWVPTGQCGAFLLSVQSPEQGGYCTWREVSNAIYVQFLSQVVSIVTRELVPIVLELVAAFVIRSL